MREGLKMLIDGTGGFNVRPISGRWRTRSEHQRHQARRHPHDIGPPGIDGIEGTRQLRGRFPDVPILALTVYDADANVFNAICAGASGTS